MSRRKNTAEAYEILHRIYQKRKDGDEAPEGSRSGPADSTADPSRSSEPTAREGSAAARSSRRRRVELEPLLRATGSPRSKGWIGRGLSRLTRGPAPRSGELGRSQDPAGARGSRGPEDTGEERGAPRGVSRESAAESHRRETRQAPPPQRWLSSGPSGPWRPSEPRSGQPAEPDRGGDGREDRARGDGPRAQEIGGAQPSGDPRSRSSDVFDEPRRARVSLHRDVWDVEDDSRATRSEPVGRAPWLADEERAALLRDPPYRVPEASAAYVPAGVSAEGACAEGAAVGDPRVAEMNGLEARYPTSHRASGPSSGSPAVAPKGGTISGGESLGGGPSRGDSAAARGGAKPSGPRASDPPSAGRGPADREAPDRKSGRDPAETSPPRRARGKRRRPRAEKRTPPEPSEAEPRDRSPEGEGISGVAATVEPSGLGAARTRPAEARGVVARPVVPRPEEPDSHSQPEGETTSWTARLRGWLLGTTGASLLERRLELRLSTVVGFGIAAILIAVLVLMEAGVPGRRDGYSSGVPIDGLPETDVAADPGSSPGESWGPGAEPPDGYRDRPETTEIGEVVEDTLAEDSEDPEGGAPSAADPTTVSSERPLPIWGPGSSSISGDSTARRRGGIGRQLDPDLREIQRVEEGSAPGLGAHSGGAAPGDDAQGASGDPIPGNANSGDEVTEEPEPTSYHTIQTRAGTTKDEADALVGYLHRIGFPEAFSALYDRTSDGRGLYYVLVGKFSSGAQAKDRLRDLRAAVKRQPNPRYSDFGQDSYTRERTDS